MNTDKDQLVGQLTMVLWALKDSPKHWHSEWVFLGATPKGWFYGCYINGDIDQLKHGIREFHILHFTFLHLLGSCNAVNVRHGLT